LTNTMVMSHLKDQSYFAFFFYKFYCAKIIYNMYKSKVYKTVPLTSLDNLKSL